MAQFFGLSVGLYRLTAAGIRRCAIKRGLEWFVVWKGETSGPEGYREMITECGQLWTLW